MVKSQASTSDSRLASDVVEVVDEGGNVVLIFDNDGFAAYEEAERTGQEFDLERIRSQALELRDKLDLFLTDLDSIR